MKSTKNPYDGMYSNPFQRIKGALIAAAIILLFALLFSVSCESDPLKDCISTGCRCNDGTETTTMDTKSCDAHKGFSGIYVCVPKYPPFKK